MFHQTILRSTLLVAALAGLIVYAVYGGIYARELVVEIAILAILAVSLDVAAGFGGMISLCHGAIMGLAAYGYGALTVKLGWPVPLAAVAGVALSALFGTFVAAVTARTGGIFFIMATLAFGQMLYTVIFKSRWLGGDDGISGLPRLDLRWLGVDLSSSLHFAIFSVIVLGFVYAAAAVVLRSGFGRTLSGILSNERRMKALGVNTWVIKTRAFGFSALLAAPAGIIAAEQTQFISPGLLFWTVSGEILIVVILGGIGTLTGPLVGAVIFVLFKHEVSAHTDYWQAIVGLLLIMSVLAGGRGIFGQIEFLVTRRRESHA